MLKKAMQFFFSFCFLFNGVFAVSFWEKRKINAAVEDTFKLVRDESEARMLKQKLAEFFRFTKTQRTKETVKNLHDNLTKLLKSLSSASDVYELRGLADYILDSLDNVESEKVEKFMRESAFSSSISPMPPAYNPDLNSDGQDPDCTICFETISSAKEKYFRCADSENKHYTCKSCFIKHAKTQKDLQKNIREEEKKLTCPYCRSSVNLWGEQILKDACGQNFFPQVWFK